LRRRFALALACLILAAPGWAAAQVPASATVALVAGTREIRLDAAFLSRLPEIEEDVRHESGRGLVQGRYRGATLWSVLQASGLLEGQATRERARRVLKVAGRDGHVVALALAEIDPDFAGNPVLLAWRVNGEPLPDGGLRLALPGDRRGARNVRDVVRIGLE
jgi:hypothetical protein